MANAKGWTLTVDDDGNGIAGELDSKPGLGTGIVAALAGQLEATVHITDHGPGTKVSVVHVAEDAGLRGGLTPASGRSEKRSLLGPPG